MEAKPIWKSKIFWTNVVAVVSGIGAILSGQVSLQAGLPPIVLALITIVLRPFTKQPVTLKGSGK